MRCSPSSEVTNAVLINSPLSNYIEEIYGKGDLFILNSLMNVYEGKYFNKKTSTSGVISFLFEGASFCPINILFYAKI